MKKTRIIMGMPITIEIVDRDSYHLIDKVFDYFVKVDQRYSTYKQNSEISKINNGLEASKWSSEMKEVLDLCQKTREETYGYFNIKYKGKIDPSGLVKGWSINNARNFLLENKCHNFYIEAGGDIQVEGHNPENSPWIVGIRNPFNIHEIIKVLRITNKGIATSGTYIRGQHIYNPLLNTENIDNIKSLTIVGPNIYEADRFATAAFAMGEKGIDFINSIEGLEGYMVNQDQTAIFTKGFERYVVLNDD